MRILLDTNVLVSALITQGTPPDLLYQAWTDGAFDLVTSRVQLKELARVLAYERLRPHVKREEAEILLETISAAAIVVEELPEVDLSTDPDDNPILASAIAGNVDLIVSGDKRHVLELGSIAGIPIVSAREALQRIDEGSEGR